MIRILFVCLGNICRSPMAEGIMRHLVSEAGLSDQIEVDSAGTSGGHAGEQPHRGTLAVLRKHGIELRHASRQFKRQDADRFDLLVAMDDDNVLSMLGLFSKQNPPPIHYLLDFIPEGPRRRSVPDPWYTGDFDGVYEMLDQACRGLLEHVRANHLPARAAMR
ncbi:MAG TPA: low molecular weight protein-tyrosine-phosphatase [Herpetosiphonaceae bacterium]